MIEYVVNAIVGAFIGLITNYLAIKMIFKPLRPVYIGKFKLPFTPGLIPAEKTRLAESIGKAIGSKVLTGDVLKKALDDESTVSAMDRLIGEAAAGLENSSLTVRDALVPVFGDEEKLKGVLYDSAGRYLKQAARSEGFKSVLGGFLKTKANEFMTTPIKDLENGIHAAEWVDKGTNALVELINREGLTEKLSLQIEGFIDKNSENESPLSSYLPDKFFDSVKNAVSNNSDRIGGFIAGLLDNPQIRQNFVDILSGLMDTSFTTKMINVFVSKDAVYRHIKLKIEKYLESEKGRHELERAINGHVDSLRGASVGKVLKFASRDDYHNIVGSIVRFISRDCFEEKFLESLSKQITDYISNNPDATPGKLVEPLVKLEESGYGFIDNIVEFIIENYSDKAVDGVLQALLPRLLDLRISSFASVFRGGEKKPGTSAAGFLLSIISRQSDRIIEALNVPKMVSEKVAAYDSAELEEIILGVIDRELKAIVMLGGLFGFVIGLAGPVISSLLK